MSDRGRALHLRDAATDARRITRRIAVQPDSTHFARSAPVTHRGNAPSEEPLAWRTAVRSPDSRVDRAAAAKLDDAALPLLWHVAPAAIILCEPARTHF
jgi:hypothetical protein